jgi:hypothetical protein
MSWLDSIVDFGSKAIDTVGGFFGGNSMGSTLLKTALTGLALNRVTKSINKSNDAVGRSGGSRPDAPASVDPGVRIQTPADTEYKVPVLYGTAVFGGALIDARMTPDNQTMYYVYVLCENTGPLMSTGQFSEISFGDIYWNDQRIIFQADGITANYTVDREGRVDRSTAGLVRVYCYRAGSAYGVVPEGYTGTVPAASTVVPGWDGNWAMTGLAFAVVRVDYNKEKGITGMGNMTFQVSNSLNLPGDVLYDIMTNELYGANIAVEDIKVS